MYSCHWQEPTNKPKYSCNDDASTCSLNSPVCHSSSLWAQLCLHCITPVAIDCNSCFYWSMSGSEVLWQTDMLTHTGYAVWILPLFCRTTHWRWKIHQLPGNLWGELAARQVNTKHTRGNTKDWADWKHVQIVQNIHLTKVMYMFDYY